MSEEDVFVLTPCPDNWDWNAPEPEFTSPYLPTEDELATLARYEFDWE